MTMCVLWSVVHMFFVFLYSLMGSSKRFEPHVSKRRRTIVLYDGLSNTDDNIYSRNPYPKLMLVTMYGHHNKDESNIYTVRRFDTIDPMTRECINAAVCHDVAKFSYRRGFASIIFLGRSVKKDRIRVIKSAPLPYDNHDKMFEHILAHYMHEHEMMRKITDAAVSEKIRCRHENLPYKGPYICELFNKQSDLRYKYVAQVSKSKFRVAEQINFVMPYFPLNIEEWRQRYPFASCAIPVRRIMQQIFDGLNFLHRNKVVHLDIKPANILLTPSGEVRIADFGISENAFTESGTYHQPKITANYRAPEMYYLNKRISNYVDIWAAAVIYAELLSGFAVFYPQDNNHRAWKFIKQHLHHDHRNILYGRGKISSATRSCLIIMTLCSPFTARTCELFRNSLVFQKQMTYDSYRLQQRFFNLKRNSDEYYVPDPATLMDDGAQSSHSSRDAVVRRAKARICRYFQLFMIPKQDREYIADILVRPVEKRDGNSKFVLRDIINRGIDCGLFMPGDPSQAALARDIPNSAV